MALEINNITNTHHKKGYKDMSEMYFHAPVDAEVVRGHFALVGEDPRKSEPLSPEAAAELTELINAEAESHTVWGNPEIDSKNFRLNGCPVELGQRGVRLVGGEFAVFPPAPHVDSASA